MPSFVEHSIAIMVTMMMAMMVMTMMQTKMQTTTTTTTMKKTVIMAIDGDTKSDIVLRGVEIQWLANRARPVRAVRLLHEKNFENKQASPKSPPFLLFAVFGIVRIHRNLG